MTYDDTDSKRFARAQALAEVRKAQPNGLHIVLSGPTGMDARILFQMGVRATDIVAVDNDARAIETARALTPAGVRFVCDDVNRVCWSHRRRASVLFLDYFSQLTSEAVERFIQCVAFAARDGAVVAGAWSWGREGGAPRAAADAGREYALAHRMRGDGLDKAHATSGNDLARFHAFVMYANRWCKSFGVRLVFGEAAGLSAGSISYQSRKQGSRGPGTPMIYILARVSRRGSPGIEVPDLTEHMTVRSNYAASHVRDLAVTVARMKGSRVASEIVNIPEPRVRAWLAVDTQQKLGRRLVLAGLNAPSKRRAEIPEMVREPKEPA